MGSVITHVNKHRGGDLSIENILPFGHRFPPFEEVLSV
jgi:hypothetical protein